MKILVVAWYMPPFNTMGALRAGKFSKYLHESGHDVRVICGADLPYDRTLPPEIPEERILRVRAVDLGDLPRAVQRLRVALRRMLGKTATEVPRTGGASVAATSPPRSLPTRLAARFLRALRLRYEGMLYIPDPQIGWLPYAYRAGKALLADWQPDIVFASAPPFTCLIVGRMLARRSGVPWVAEYRDRFFEDPYSQPGRFRKWLERTIEGWWMKDAAGIVTVSEPWAETYRTRFGIPVATVYNGFDPDDFPADYPRRSSDAATLNIVYTGILYLGRRDPSPLFAAMRSCADAGFAVRAAFYGADPNVLSDLARRFGVTDAVDIHGRVPYRESIDLQMNADVVLLLQWNDPKEQGNVPGKLFEYLAARRPVLGIGLEDGVPARILTERHAGVVINDPAAIAARLRAWSDEKRAKAAIPLLPPSVRDGVSRTEQFRILEEFLEKTAASRPSRERRPR